LGHVTLFPRTGETAATTHCLKQLTQSIYVLTCFGSSFLCVRKSTARKVQYCPSLLPRALREWESWWLSTICRHH